MQNQHTGYSVFNRKPNDHLHAPMFMGENVNIARYDSQHHSVFEKLIEKQVSFFWRPEEVDLSRDRIDFNEKLNAAQQHIFTANIKYQVLLDSIQGRSPNVAFLPLTSLPEIETWMETWAFFETIHSRAYTHMIRNIYTNPSEVMDSIIHDPEVLKRAESISQYYDRLIEMTQYYQLLGEGVHSVNGREVVVDAHEMKKQLYLAVAAVNALEGVRFFVSFACTFSFAEQKLMEGNAKEVRFIARDENLHLQGTQAILNLMKQGKDDPEMAVVARECENEVYAIFDETVEQEKAWAKYLFKDGSIIGLNKEILCQYVEYIANVRMKAIGLDPIYETKQDPLPWMRDWLSSDAVQPAPQEVEISSYVTGQIDNQVDDEAFSGFSL